MKTDIYMYLVYIGFDFQYFIPNLLITSFLRLLCSRFVFWKVGGHAVAGKETLKYIQAVRKSPRFSLTSPLCQLREKSCRPVFTKFVVLMIHVFTYRITAFVNLTGWFVILVIMYAETFTPGIIGNVIMCLTSHWPTIFNPLISTISLSQVIENKGEMYKLSIIRFTPSVNVTATIEHKYNLNPKQIPHHYSQQLHFCFKFKDYMYW